MQDREIAVLVLRTSAQADGGCVPCIQLCIDQAVFEQPDLPWEDAVTEFTGTMYDDLAEALASARRRQASGDLEADVFSTA